MIQILLFIVKNYLGGGGGGGGKMTTMTTNFEIFDRKL